MSTIEKAAARLVKKSKDNAAQVTEHAEEQTETSNPGNNLHNVKSFDESAMSGIESVAQAPASPPERAAPDQYHKSCELDFPWLEQHGFLVPNHNNPKQSQEFRRIKRPLLLNMQDTVAKTHSHPTNIVFVTSALPGEGKTFVSLNLALSLAGELDKSVLLLDGDAAKGDLSRWMGIYGEQGLVDLLRDGNAYGESSIIDTNVERLSVMPCGARVDNLDELYASDLMSSLLDGMARRNPNRVIVVDGPPLLATTEATVLAGVMGQTVVVVEANKTPQSAVERAVAHLDSAQLVSILLNKTEGSESGFGYGYGYGYGYGHSTAD